MESKTDQAESVKDNAARTKKERTEIISTIILSIAALAAAWCGYQSTLWDGIQTFKLADMNGANRQAGERNLILTQRRAVDADMTMNFISAYAENNEKELNFYLTRTRPEFRKILSSWMEMDKANNPQTPPHPLAMAEYQALYKEQMDSVESLRKQGHDLYDEANNANRTADTYIMLTVFFSVVLFLGALSTQIESIKAKKVLIYMSGLLCIGSLIYLIAKMPYTGGS